MRDGLQKKKQDQGDAACRKFYCKKTRIISYRSNVDKHDDLSFGIR